MIRIRAALLSVPIVLALGAPLRAESSDALASEYLISTWREQHGLPPGRIWAVQQGQKGYLWFGTDVGIVRFDGLRFTTWPIESAGAILSMVIARDGTIWAGIGGTGGVARVRGSDVRLYRENDGIAAGFIVAMLEDSRGTIWAGGRAGLHRFDHDWWERLDSSSGLPDEPIVGLFEDSRKNLWATTAAAVFRRSDPAGRFEQVATIEVLGNIWPRFSEAPDGSIWMTDEQHGFTRITGTGPDIVSPFQARGAELLHDRRGDFWVATQGNGLWRVRTNANGTPDIQKITADTGLASDAVRCLLEDREGNIWVGTYAGLNRLSPKRVDTITGLMVPRTIASMPDGTVWVGTSDGLVRFQGETKTRYDRSDGLPGSIVFSLHADARGTLWAATDRGLATFDGHRFVAVPQQGTPDLRRIFGMTGSRDALWVRDLDHGLFRLTTQGVDAPPSPEGFGAVVSTLHQDSEGNLWAGWSNQRLGVIRANGSFESFDVDVGEIASIYEDRSGALWIGGRSGLARLSDGRIEKITASNGFPGYVVAITEDSKGALWLGLAAGIGRIDRSEFEKGAANRSYEVRYRLIDSSDGVAGSTVRLGDPSVARSADGRLWFVTGGGVTVIDPDRLGDPPAAPPARVESVTADGQRFEATPDLRLPPNVQHLLIDFTAVTFADPMKVRVRYRLEGFNNDWIDAGASRQASYANLPPRDYRFHVMASSAPGIWNETGGSFAFTIAPAFYQTWWFYGASLLTIAAVVWASWRVYVNQMRRQYALVLGERIRMSRAIHDTLLQGLVGIALHLDDLSSNGNDEPQAARDRLQRIRMQVEHYIREARQSIWDLRSPSLTDDDLAQALKQTAERTISDLPVQLDFSVKGRERRCSPLAEEQILLIGQEALNNAVRHSGGRRIGVELAYEPDALRLRVSDDGQGFVPGNGNGNGNGNGGGAAAMHYGLSSMRERAEHAGGRLTVRSQPGSGTIVEAVVPAEQRAS